MERDFNFDIMPEIKKRWSPRAFDTEAEISNEDLLPLIEAARYAPSALNEQPWKFIIANELDSLNNVRSVLDYRNRIWADSINSFLILLTKKSFTSNGEVNPWCKFDAGAAWGFLSLEAEKRGFITHALGSFNNELLKEKFNIPDEYEPIILIGVGKMGDKENLPTDFVKEREYPGLRNPLEDIYTIDKFK